jgi:hypothetical protein
MQLIEHYEVPSGGVSSITFDAIPDTFTDLYLVISGRVSLTEVVGNTFVSINSSTSNFTFRSLFGSGSSSGSGAGTDNRIGVVNGNTSTASIFGSSSVYFPNYTSSVAKSFSADNVSENNATEAYQQIVAGLWNPAVQAAISELTIVPAAGIWLQYSSATLYGILAGSDGIVAVS